MSKRRVVKNVKGKNGKRVSRAYWVNAEAKRLAKPRSNRIMEALFGTSHLPAETRMQMAQMQWNRQQGLPLTHNAQQFNAVTTQIARSAYARSRG
jgi:hypothetical protein